MSASSGWGLGLSLVYEWIAVVCVVLFGGRWLESHQLLAPPWGVLGLSILLLPVLLYSSKRRLQQIIKNYEDEIK